MDSKYTTLIGFIEAADQNRAASAIYSIAIA